MAQEGSQQSAIEDTRYDASTHASSLATLYKPTKCLPKVTNTDLELITAYLAKEKAPSLVQAAFARVSNVCTQRVVRANQDSTEQAIRQLQAVVQKLADKVDKAPNRLAGPSLGSYAEAAKLGLPTQTRAQSLNTTHVTPQKPVPARHKREIIVIQGAETPEQKARSYKELLEQLNKTGVIGEVVAIRQLPGGDMTLTIVEIKGY